MFCSSQCTSRSPQLGLILSFFILFDAVINKIVLLISSSKCLLLMYTNTIHFHVLLLYRATLLDSFILTLSLTFDYIMFILVSEFPHTISLPEMPTLHLELVTTRIISNIPLVILSL